jgi:nucleoside-diphosphate-sugar epimerase
MSVGIYRSIPSYAWKTKTRAILKGTLLGLLVYTTWMRFAFNQPVAGRGGSIIASFVAFGILSSLRFLSAFVQARFSILKLDGTARRRINTVLVVGGAGYIGSVLTRALLKKGYKVRVLDILAYGRSPIEELVETKQVELIEGDLRRVDSAVAALRGVDCVFHLGAIVGDPASALDANATVQINWNATRMLVDAAAALGVWRFIFASSCSVYGYSDAVVDENSVPNPVSLYAASKLDAEDAALNCPGETAVTVLRLATVFGYSYRPRFDLVVNLLTAKAVAEGQIAIFGGQQWRPFVHVDDVVRAMILCMESPEHLVSRQIFNVGANNLNVQIAELGEVIRKTISGTQVEIHHDARDTRSYRVSFDKVRDRLGFECQVSLAQGIAEMARALHSGEIKDYRDPRYSNIDMLTSSYESILNLVQPEPSASVRFIKKATARSAAQAPVLASEE